MKDGTIDKLEGRMTVQEASTGLLTGTNIGKCRGDPADRPCMIMSGFIS